MKITKYLVFIILALLSNSSLRPMADEEAYYDRDLADFTMIEVTNEPAKKAKMDVEEAKNLILKAEKKLRAIKDVAESDELQTTIKTTKSIANALRKLAFKNGPGFEIVNRTTKPIWVSVIVDGKIETERPFFGYDKIEAGEPFALELDTLKENIMVGVYQTKPTTIVKLKNGNLSVTPDFLYKTKQTAQGKTKYFSWNPSTHKVAAKYLYPQTGKLGGLAKGSSSGYLLTNNIKGTQIKLQAMKEVVEEKDVMEEEE